MSIAVLCRMVLLNDTLPAWQSLGHLMGRKLAGRSNATCCRVLCCAVELASECRVAVLDGGLQAWQAKGFPLDTQIASEVDMDAAAHAASQAPSSPPKYPAKLQVSM